MGGGAPEIKIWEGAPRKLKYWGGERPRSSPTHPPYFLNGIALKNVLTVSKTTTKEGFTRWGLDSVQI